MSKGLTKVMLPTQNVKHDNQTEKFRDGGRDAEVWTQVTN